MRLKSGTASIAGSVLSLILLLSLTASRTHAQLQHPIDVAAAPDGTIYVADRKLPGIWKINDGQAAVFFQAEKRFGTPLNAIRSIAIDADGKLLAGDSGTFTVYRFDDAGQPQPTHRGRIGIPMGIAAAADGSIYVSDLEVGQIVKIPAAEGDEVPERQAVATVAAPRGLWFDANGDLLIVSARPGQLRKMSADGTVSEVVKDMPFMYPSAVVTIDDKVFVCDSFADTIFEIAADGTPSEFAKGEPFVHPVGLTVHDGQLVVADSRGMQIVTVTADGTASVMEVKE